MLKIDKDRWASIKTTSKSTFDKSWTTGKKGFDKGWKALDKLGNPVNKLSNKLGSEAFWPMAIDLESEKAARILKTFLGDEPQDIIDEEPSMEGKEGVPQGRQRVAKKIPPSVIANAKAIAVFTACRTGFWVSSAGGSGILIRRLQPDDPSPTRHRFESIDLNDDPPAYTPNAARALTPPSTPPGKLDEKDQRRSPYWSPPSGILLHTAALGFLAGADIYDCVMVLNTDAAVEAFTNPRLTLGAEVSVAAGPYSVGGVLDQNIGGGVRHLNEMRKRKTGDKMETKETAEQGNAVDLDPAQTPEKKSTWTKVKDERPVWSYLKSRGLYLGLGQLDGSIVIERTDENARFYESEGVKVKQILGGGVDVPPQVSETGGVYALWDTLDAVVEKAAMGNTSNGRIALSGIVTRAKQVVVRPRVIVDDDPFGVQALEKNGIHLVEAGTHRRVASDEFNKIFPPSPRTPVSLRSVSPPPLPRRGGSLRSVKTAEWVTEELNKEEKASKEDKDCLDNEFETVPLRNEEAIRRAEAEIKEWERQAKEKEEKEREERRAKMKRLSDDGMLEKILSNETVFDFNRETREKERENLRRSTYRV